VRYRWYLSTGKRFGPNSYDAPEGYSLHLDDYKDLDRLPTLEEWRGLALKRAGFRTSPNVETLSQKTRVRKSA